MQQNIFLCNKKDCYGRNATALKMQRHYWTMSRAKMRLKYRGDNELNKEQVYKTISNHDNK